MKHIGFTPALALSVALVAGFAFRASAQPHYISALEYSVGVPIGDTHNFLPVGGWSGAAWESRWMEAPHTTIGFLAGFNEFYRRESGTFTFPSGAATGDQYRHLLMVPVLFTGHWYYNDNRDDPRWYIGGGGGVQFTQQELQLGLNRQTRNSTNIVLVPEVGLAFTAWYGTGGIVSVRYHLPSESSPLLGGGDRRFQYLSFSVGLGYR
jgi:hypothetical protein